MANEEHLAILKRGVEVWNAWREEKGRINIGLSEANLSHSNLSGANLSGVNLSGANLNGADLTHSNLGFANLNAADLSGADLGLAILYYANLSSANLNAADLGLAILHSTDLKRADLSGSNMSQTVLAALDLRETIGLNLIQHRGESTLGANTLSLSQGKIPDAFLRGCGLSDWEIANARLHDPTLSSGEVIDITYEVARIRAESPIQVNPIFISYSHADTAFVESLEKLLDAKRVRYWRDVHDMTSGRLETQIDRAIRHNPTVLIVLSEHSTESDWVRWEVSKARELEKEYREDGKPRDVLCPISLDDSWKNSSWPGPLRQQIEDYNILPFSNWEDEAKMEEAFKKLFKGLGLYYREG